MHALKTQAMKLAGEHAATISDDTMKSIRTIQRIVTWSVYGVMLTSYFHQMAYLFANFPLHWEMSLVVLTHTLSYLIGVLIIPLIFDALTISCIKVMGTVGFKPAAKRFAKRVIILPALISGYINWMASDTYTIAIVYVLVVAIIPVLETLKTKSHEIDYDGIDAIERRTLKSIERMGAEDAPETKVAAGSALPLDAMMAQVVLFDGDLEKAKAFVEYEKMSKGDKQSWSRRFNNAKARWLAETSDPGVAAIATVAPAPRSADPANFVS